MTEPHRNPSSTPPPDLLHRLSLVGLALSATGQEQAAAAVSDAIELLAARSNQEATPDEAVEKLISRAFGLLNVSLVQMPHGQIREEMEELVGELRERETRLAKPVQEATRTVGDAE